MGNGPRNPQQTMATQTQFDLNRSLQQWRDELTQSAALRPDDVAELETHLNDSMAALRRQGLSDQEAFLIATKRLGAPAQLADEFGKVNPAQVWLNRLVWMLVGMLLIQLVSQTTTQLALFSLYTKRAKSTALSRGMTAANNSPGQSTRGIRR